MRNADLVARKLTILGEHVARLRRRRPVSAEAMLADVDLQDAISLSVLVVVQEATDIALHMISDEGWGAAASYREGFETLAAHRVIAPDLARQLGGAVAVRNRIAHGYASVDFERLWAELPAAIDAFESFAQAIAAWVSKPA